MHESAARLRWVGVGLLGAALALGVAARAGALEGFDRAVIDQLAAWRAWSDPWLVATRAGDVVARILVCGVAMLLLWRRGDRRAALFLPTAALVETLLNSLLKLGFGRARPDLLAHLDPVTTLSYPSGHSAHNAALWLMAALLLAPGRAAAIAIALGVAGLIGVSRIVLGVHWPSDVAGGWMIGAGFALVAVSLHRKSGTFARLGT